MIVSRKAYITVLSLLIVVIVFFLTKEVLFGILSRPLNNLFGNIYSNQYYIAHAGGQVDSLTYLNCREGLQQSLEQGFKYIEFDLCLTDDDQLVFTHDKETFLKMAGGGEFCNRRFSKDVFKRTLLHNRYHTLDVEDVLPLLKRHIFVLVTDRLSNPDLIDRWFSEVKDDIKVEAITIEDFNELKKRGYHPMLTIGDLNHNEFWYYLKLAIINEYPIDWIVISATQSDFRYVRILKRLFDVKTAMYTQNEKSFFEQYAGREADLIYTDFWNFN